MGRHPEPPSQGKLVFAEVILYRSVDPLPLKPLGIKSQKPRATGGWSLARTETFSSSHKPLPIAEGVMASHPLWLSEYFFSTAWEHINGCELSVVESRFQVGVRNTWD